MAQSNRLRPIAEGELPPEFLADPNQGEPLRPQPQAQQGLERAATSILFTSLRALSQRTLVAVANLFVLMTAGSAFWLWFVTIPNPSVLQLVGLCLYGILILLLNWLVLRRR